MPVIQLLIDESVVHKFFFMYFKFKKSDLVEGVDMFYVGISHYFATGEGCTIYVASGSEESIRQSIPGYFHPGLTILTPTEWLEAATKDCDDKYHQAGAKIIKIYLPELWRQIEERSLGGGCHLEFFMRHHFNYS